MVSGPPICISRINLSWPVRENAVLQRNAILNWSGYELQQSGDLRTWEAVPTNGYALSGTNSLSLPRPATAQFYRIKSP